MKMILLGAPGVGKGTQAKFICEKLSMPQISTGDILREAVRAGTSLGNKVKGVMNSGALVADEIIIDLVKERIAQRDCRNGYLFDGFPRTIPQAEALIDQRVDIQCVLEIAVPDGEIINRLSGRRVHIDSGRVYHVVYSPPKVPGKDDETGDELIQRHDDKEETIVERLAVYREQTKPLVLFYKELSGKEGSKLNYYSIDGMGNSTLVRDKILSILDDFRTKFVSKTSSCNEIDGKC